MPPLTIECDIHLQSDGRGARKTLVPGRDPDAVPACEPGRVPRVARFMALAIRFEGLIRKGAIENYATLAALGHVTRARVTQIMNLLQLAPDIQEAILHLPHTEKGRDPIALWMLQPIAATLDWRLQRRLWRELEAKTGRP